MSINPRRDTLWSGDVVRRARAAMAPRLPAACGRCGKTVTRDQPWVVGHIKSRLAYPELTLDPSNWQHEHRACSDGSTGESIAELALRNAGIETETSTRSDSGFSLPTGTQADLALPVSLPEAKADPLAIPAALSWSAFCQRAPAWLEPYLQLDEFASPPLAVSPLHPAAVGTHADQAISWIEKVEGKRLRWWQALALALQLQHDAEGRLLKETVVETAPRRSGKSVRLRGTALWRMEHGPALFGERQEIVHTGSDLAVCRKAQKEAWRFAESRWGAKSVTRGNGKEAVENPEDGSVWLVRAQDACYGWDTTLALVDEGWDVRPDTVSEGLEPSLLERQSPQLHLTSTSHRRARSTMRTALLNALADDDPKVLLLWWGAAPGADISDPETWRLASPYWTPERAEYVAAKYAKALAGEADPEFDDPDPMRGFACQYANVWSLRERRSVGEPLVTVEAWQGVHSVHTPDVAPSAVAVEAWPGAGVSVAAAWRLEDGRTLVSASGHVDVADAAVTAKAWGCKTPLLVGASLVADPAFKGIRTKAQTGTLPAAVSDLSRWLTEGSLAHDGGEHLGVQVTGMRTKATPTGMRITSAGAADAIKATAWAVGAARSRRTSGGSRILLPSSISA